jgi:hypothetical protein
MSDESPINVSDIMQYIERQVWAKSREQDEPWLPISDPELRAHLVRLRELAGGLQLDVPLVERGSVPLVSPLIAWGRRQLHQLVLFYMGGVTRHQAAFAQAVTRTVIYLAERYEAQNKALRAEVEELSRELAQAREE